MAAAFGLTLRWISLRYERQRSRHELRRLSDRMLKDIGVARPDADREARRPFWE
jgi:uncharacterized protein YjiS (DUF1127 family)